MDRVETDGISQILSSNKRLSDAEENIENL
jgi:hypothetical protein